MTIQKKKNKYHVREKPNLPFIRNSISVTTTVYVHMSLFIVHNKRRTCQQHLTIWFISNNWVEIKCCTASITRLILLFAEVCCLIVTSILPFIMWNRKNTEQVIRRALSCSSFTIKSLTLDKSLSLNSLESYFEKDKCNSYTAC